MLITNFHLVSIFIQNSNYPSLYWSGNASPSLLDQRNNLHSHWVKMPYSTCCDVVTARLFYNVKVFNLTSWIIFFPSACLWKHQFKSGYFWMVPIQIHQSPLSLGNGISSPQDQLSVVKFILAVELLRLCEGLHLSNAKWAVLQFWRKHMTKNTKHKLMSCRHSELAPKSAAPFQLCGMLLFHCRAVFKATTSESPL